MSAHHENIRDLLHHVGLKSTPLREKLVEVLKKSKKPLSAEEITKKIRGVSFDQASLFRSLKKLTEAGLISQVNLGEGFARYEAACEAHDHHHHVRCTSCQAITVLPFCIPPRFEAWLKKAGYTAIQHRLDFLALCPRCS